MLVKVNIAENSVETLNEDLSREKLIHSGSRPQDMSFLHNVLRTLFFEGQPVDNQTGQYYIARV